MNNTLAPRFTPDNAAFYARRAVISRESNRAKLKAGYAQDKRDNRHTDFAGDEVMRVLRAMRRVKPSDKDYALLASILDRLWNKAFPTQGAVKSRPGRSQSQSIEPLSEPVQPPATPHKS